MVPFYWLTLVARIPPFDLSQDSGSLSIAHDTFPTFILLDLLTYNNHLDDLWSFQIPESSLSTFSFGLSFIDSLQLHIQQIGVHASNGPVTFHWFSYYEPAANSTGYWFQKLAGLPLLHITLRISHFGDTGRHLLWILGAATLSLSEAVDAR